MFRARTFTVSPRRPRAVSSSAHATRSVRDVCGISSGQTGGAAVGRWGRHCPVRHHACYTQQDSIITPPSIKTFSATDSDLAMSIVETCGDPTTQIGCIDDTCFRLDEDGSVSTSATAFDLTVPMVAGNTYSVYLGKLKDAFLVCVRVCVCVCGGGGVLSVYMHEVS